MILVIGVVLLLILLAIVDRLMGPPYGHTDGHGPVN